MFLRGVSLRIKKCLQIFKAYFQKVVMPYQWDTKRGITVIKK